MLKYGILLFVLSSLSVASGDSKKTKTASGMVINVNDAVEIYRLGTFLTVGEISPSNRHVVLCRASDNGALFNFLNQEKRLWGRDRLPNKSHKDRIWAYRAKARPSFHLTEVEANGGVGFLIEADIDSVRPRLSRPWTIAWHLYDVAKHRVTGGVTPPEKMKKGLIKLGQKLRVSDMQ